jgi:hypothetical protein
LIQFLCILVAAIHLQAYDIREILLAPKRRDGPAINEHLRTRRQFRFAPSSSLPRSDIHTNQQTGDADMIRFERSGQIAQGKDLEAIAWAKEITTFLNGKYSQANVQVFSHRFGVIDTLAWQVDFDSLASLDKYQKTLNDDEGYWALIGKSTGLFVANTIFDTVLETL